LENYRDLFLGLENASYFYTGAESPSLKENKQSLTKYLEDKSKGELGRERARKVEEEFKENISKLIRADSCEISLTGNASEAINNIIDAMEIKSGSNIILNSLEYPSVVLPFLSLQKEKDIEIRILDSESGEINADEIEKSIDRDTCLVAFSHVSYVNGFRNDLKTLKKITDQKQVPLLIDATQSLGVVDVDSNYFDMMVSSSYKWLLGPHGVGLTYISKEYLPKLKPKRVGWRSVPFIFTNKRFEEFEFSEDATKFELGFNNYPAIYALKESTDLLLKIGISKIEERVTELGNELIYRLKKNGWSLLTPEDKDKRSGNIAVVCRNGEKVMKELDEKNIKIWGGDGRLRFSVNFYNNVNDIQNLIRELSYIKERGEFT